MPRTPLCQQMLYEGSGLRTELYLRYDHDGRDFPMGPSYGSRDEWHAAPRVCELPLLNFTMISMCLIERTWTSLPMLAVLSGVFHYGLVKFEEVSKQWTEDWSYYPPVEFDDRLHHLALPLLRNLKRYKVDLVSFSSMLWDQVHWRAEAGSSEVLSDTMLATYAERLDVAIKAIAGAFDAPTILWRTSQ